MNSSRIWALVLLVALVSVASSSAGEDVEVTGLWSVFCNPQDGAMDFESSHIGEFTMVLYQEGPFLFGACTGEIPEPWNGLVMGEVEEDQILLTISMLNPKLTMARINGELLDGSSIEGNFVCSDEEGRGWHGTFTGWLTNPDTSFYEPALVEQVQTELPSTLIVPIDLAESQANLSASQAEPQYAETLQELEALMMEPGQEKEAKTIYRIDYSRDTIYPRPVM